MKVEKSVTWNPKVSSNWGWRVFFFTLDWRVRRSSGNRETLTKGLHEPVDEEEEDMLQEVDDDVDEVGEVLEP